MKLKCGDCAHFKKARWFVYAGPSFKARCKLHSSKRLTEKSKACKDFYNMGIKQ
jgi:hypothetical protein